MKLSTRSTYGMRALVELALAAGRGPMSATAIAKRQDLSLAYLEQLLHRLKKHGLVTSVRGPRGGYVLARDAQRITMADVVQVLDAAEDAQPPAAARATARRARDAQQHAQRISRAVRHCVHERLNQSLGAVTLQDLCDEAGADAPLDHRYEFHI
jgi:Rrf2 family protein